MNDEQARLAFLVDAENVRPSCVREILEGASAYGRPVIRRAYSADRNVITSWRTSVFAPLGVTPVYVPSASKGKNSADIMLVIDAMELALTKRADAVCVVSSDGDFTMLGHRLREAGAFVMGAGNPTSPAGWRGACDVFFEFAGSQSEPAEAPPPAARRLPQTGELAAFVADMARAGTVELSRIGTALRSEFPGFRPKLYGHPNLSTLVAALDGVSVSYAGEFEMTVSADEERDDAAAAPDGHGQDATEAELLPFSPADTAEDSEARAA